MEARSHLAIVRDSSYMTLRFPCAVVACMYVAPCKCKMYSLHFSYSAVATIIIIINFVLFTRTSDKSYVEYTDDVGTVLLGFFSSC